MLSASRGHVEAVSLEPHQRTAGKFSIYAPDGCWWMLRNCTAQQDRGNEIDNAPCRRQSDGVAPCIAQRLHISQLDNYDAPLLCGDTPPPSQDCLLYAFCVCYDYIILAFCVVVNRKTQKNRHKTCFLRFAQKAYVSVVECTQFAKI